MEMEIVGKIGEKNPYGVCLWGYRLLFVPKDGKSRHWVVTDGDRDRFLLRGEFCEFKKKDLEELGYSWVIDSGMTTPSYYGEGEVFQSEEKFKEVSRRRNLRDEVNKVIDSFLRGYINKKESMDRLEELL